MKNLELLSFIIFYVVVFYAILTASLEAYLFKSTVKKNHHPVIYALRCIVVGSIITILFITTLRWESFLMLVSSILVFSYIHNGVLYSTMNNIDGNAHKGRWRSHTSLSDAIMNFNYNTRHIMYVFGFSLHVVLVSYWNFDSILLGVVYFIYAILGLTFPLIDKKI
jgi:hypothetical protein